MKRTYTEVIQEFSAFKQRSCQVPQSTRR